MPETPMRKVTIFVSSPKDVAPERGRVQAVAAKLNREYDDLVRFETVLWEEHFYTADKSFQPQIPEAIASDIVVSIFWTRIGTELPTDFPRMPNGRPYPSGTAYELLTALEGSKAKGVPDVYVFRKSADATLPMLDAERRRQAQTQLDALEAFWSEWFRSETGEFKAAFQNFLTTDAFEQQIELLLRQWLDTHGVLGPRIAWPKEKGSPFRGLAPFEAEHAAVFFGRDRVIDAARRRLVAAAERGSPFLLIVGASGSGKSSLARAGLIPRLTTPGVVTSVDLWRVARMKPSEGQTGPLMALATSLLATDALPELVQGDYPTAASLADNLQRGGNASVQPITGALGRVAEDSQRERHADQAPKSALVLLVDQFEELFAQRVSDAERAAFAESLRQLIATGRVWVVTTLRADLYELLLKQPALKALKETGASLDLGPPGPAELAEIVRAPAAAAGLVFETNAEQGDLGERLLADAKTADSLPLLQFTLRQLYERREEIAGDVRLTHAAYDQLGGLAGAIAAEAERAVSSLPPDAVAALPRLLRRLAEPARDGKTLTLREEPRAEVAIKPSEVTLVDVLLAARILIARTDADGRPTVRLAHGAVLASWPRASEAAQASREFYRVRAEVEDALRRWQEHGRPKDRLIQPGVPLAEAEKLVADFGAELPAELTSFVTASRHRARRRQRFERAAAVFFFALAAIATAASVWAYVERDRSAQALATIVQTGNTLVYDLGANFFVLGLPTDLFGRMIDRAIQGYDQAIQRNPKNAIAYVNRGFAYAIKGDHDRAIQDCDHAIQLDPRNAVAYRNRGIAYGSKGDNERAIQDYDQAIQLDPKDAMAYASRGNIYKSKGDYSRAIQDFDQTVQLDPKNATFYIARGYAHNSKGDHDRAIQDYDQAIQLAPTFPFAYAGRGDAYGSKGDHDRAIQDYDKAIQLDPINPRNVDAYVGRGNVYESKGDNNRAIQDFDQAIQLDPKNAFAYRSRGIAYENKGDQDRAIQDYGQAIQLKDPNAYTLRGILYIKKGDRDRAVEDFDQAIQLDPQNSQAYASRGLAYALNRDYEHAMLDLDQAIRLDPNNAAAHKGRGAAYESKGDQDRAIHDYGQAIQLDPKDAIAYVSRGTLYTNKGDHDRAIQDYDKAIELDSKNATSYLKRGDAYESKGDHDRAIPDYDQAIQLDAKNFLALVSRGLAYLRKGDPDRAIQDYDQAIQLDSKNAAFYFNRGDAYESKGDYDRAIQDYDLGIQLDPKNAGAHSKRGFASFYQGNFKAAAAALSRANELEEDTYSIIWRYLARERAGENGTAELEADAARLKSADWPYPVIELYLGRRSPADVLSATGKADERCEAQFYNGEWHLLRGNRATAATALQAAADICSKDFLEYKGALIELKRLNL
jgi:tetratricopeptide (TPR) repeat protein